MKRPLFILSLTLLTGLSSAQVKLSVVQAGKAVGTATLSQKLRQDGSKQIQMSMEMKSAKDVLTFRSESIYLPSGAPLRKFQELNAPAQKFRRTVIVEFNSRGAKVTLDINGQRSTKSVDLPANASNVDKSEFWFVRDKPKEGTKESCYSFSLETLAWDLAVTTYQGASEITVGGKKVKAHKTQSERGIAYVDDQGLPLKLELANGSMERVWG